MATTVFLPSHGNDFITINFDEYRDFCIKAQQDWDSSKVNQKLVGKMSRFEKKKTFRLIWESNMLEGTLPKGATQPEAERVLIALIDSEVRLPDIDKFQQLGNHLEAYFLLCSREHSTDPLPPLTEELIQSVHKVMMTGLKTEEGHEVKAGAYREKSVHAGTHVFPSYECVPQNMARIVNEYESKISSSHDQYQLASWLFYQVVSLHPFEDGNGRLSRLLWCYSLMRDGLPFPPVLTSGHRRSQKHLVRCLERDRRLSVTGQPNLTQLTVVSVRNAWDCFYKDADA